MLLAIGDGHVLCAPYLAQPGHVARAVKAHNPTITRFEGISPLLGAIYRLVIHHFLVIFHNLILLSALSLGNGVNRFLQSLHGLEEIEEADQSIHHLVQKSNRRPMPFHCIDHPRIETHSDVIGEHLAEGPLGTLHLLLVLYVIDGALWKGAYLHIPHVVMADCSIHPLFYQTTQSSQLVPRHLRATRTPSQTPAEVVSRPNRQDTYHYR